MPFTRQIINSYFLAIGDGPTEVHKITLARQILRDYNASDDLFPSRHLLKEREKARKKFGQLVGPTDDQL